MALQLPDRLQSQRLILREPRAADAALIFDAYTQDIEVARHMVWRPHQAASQTADFIAACMQAWASGLGRPYVLALLGNEHVPVGMLEARILSHTVDFGYVLRRSCWGAGLMPEAVIALSDAALSLQDCFRVQATCSVENRASARTLEKSGFVREAQLDRYAVFPNLGAEPRACFMYARCR
jgi:ribosomal-protein-alanine N-acetyltransferase